VQAQLADASKIAREDVIAAGRMSQNCSKRLMPLELLETFQSRQCSNGSGGDPYSSFEPTAREHYLVRQGQDKGRYLNFIKNYRKNQSLNKTLQTLEDQLNCDLEVCKVNDYRV